MSCGHGFSNAVLVTDPSFEQDPAVEDLTVRPASITNSAAEWDERYSGSEQVWSGQPNAALVTEVAGLDPGRALDVGCGEGADAVWLAGRRWQVTAIDVSQVALERAALVARDAGAHVRWLHAGLVDALLPAGGD